MKLHKLFPEISLNPANAKDIKQWILQLAMEGKLTKKWREENRHTEDNWIERKLFEIAEINGGYAFKSQQYTDNGVRVIRISDFDEQGLKNEKIVRHPYSSTFEAFRLKPFNIIMAMTGGTVGKALLVQEVVEDMFVNQRVANIKITDTSLPNFVFLVLKTTEVQNVIENAKNSTNDNISMNDIKNFIIPVPPVEEQQAIVRIVEELFKEVDELAQQATQRIELKRSYAQAALNRLCEADTASEWNQIISVFPEIFNDKQTIKTLRETILQLAVQGKLTAKWRRANPSLSPASELLEQIKAEKTKLIKEKKIKAEKPLPPIEADEIPFELPEGWEWCRMGEIIRFMAYGTSQKTNDNSNNVPVLRMGNILTSGELHFNNLKYISKNHSDLPKLYLKKNDIVFNRTNSFELVGKSAVFMLNDDEYTLASYLIKVSLFNEFIDSVYIKNYINSNICRKHQIEPQITAQTNQANFSGSKLKEIIVPICSVEEQKVVVSKVHKLFGIFDELEKEIEKMSENLNKLQTSI